jgi:hypothetical protein
MPTRLYDTKRFKVFAGKLGGRVFCALSETHNNAPIAQLDRVTDYESVGRVFESPWAHQKIPTGQP